MQAKTKGNPAHEKSGCSRYVDMIAQTRDNPRRRTRTLKFGIVLALTSVIMTMWAVVAGSIINWPQSIVASTRREAIVVTGAFGRQVSQTFDQLVTASNAVAARMRAANGNFDLYDWAHELPLIDGATVQAIIVDPKGKLEAASGDPHPQPVDFSGREEF